MNHSLILCVHVHILQQTCCLIKVNGNRPCLTTVQPIMTYLVEIMVHNKRMLIFFNGVDVSSMGSNWKR